MSKFTIQVVKGENVKKCLQTLEKTLLMPIVVLSFLVIVGKSGSIANAYDS